MPSPTTRLTVGLLLSGLLVLPTSAAKKVLQAGAFTADITPTNFPVIVNGGFREKTSDTVLDPLRARFLVLDDGNERIAMVVVDSCMVPRDLLDQAKVLANQSTGIRTDRMLISSTHTHSGPSAMGALGSSADPHYIKVLPAMIADGIRRANERLQPARIGWAVTKAPDHTNCRRWILRPDKMRTDPFGDKTVRTTMHPGHQNSSFIGPSAPVDTGLSILSVQTSDGEPLAMFANFSMHYYGAGAISADYFGAFPEEFAKLIHAVNGSSDFVAAMSQGTSGDLQWMDYSEPRRTRDLRQYAAELADIAHTAYEQIEHRPWVSLAMAEAKVTLNRRLADKARLAVSQKIAATLKNRKPATQQEIYAREQVLIAANPVRELILQAVRIGDVGITALPNEVYSLTGLKLKALSPLATTFNIELANGSEGYIPPPEQHRLGGYTTWEARSAALETNAEPKIINTLLGLLEKVADKPRRKFTESHGPYAREIMAAKPMAYWRMGELAGASVADSTGKGHRAKLEPGFALHLEGTPGDGFGNGSIVNRAVQFAGGKLLTDLTLPKTGTIEFWFWNGLPASARKLSAILCSLGADTLQLLPAEKSDSTVLKFSDGPRGKTILPLKTWHHIAIVRQDGSATVWLNGTKELRASSKPDSSPLIIGGDANDTANLEGKIDEIAVYARALSAKEISARISRSGIAKWRQAEQAKKQAESASRTRQLAGPAWKAGYATAIANLKPALHWDFDSATGGVVDGGVTFAQKDLDSEKPKSANLSARFHGGRIKTKPKSLPLDYSASVWFRNDQPNNSRPVTGYFFSRGPDGDRTCPGDHLGIGGEFKDSLPGRLIVFNGNQLNRVAVGKKVIEPLTWNHVVMVRHGHRIKAYLNGNPTPEIDAEVPPSIAADETRLYFGGRNDNYSNLNGYLDEATVFDRALSAEEAVKLYAASGVKAPTPPAIPKSVELESKPLSPSTARRTIKVRAGYTVELVAAEPLVKDPVAIDWGADGRLWVAEMADYPNGMDDKGKAGGRVRLLEDTDHDGRYDKSTVFLDGLNFPNGVMAWRKGVLITAAPKIIYAEDTDADGKADQQKTMYEGFNEGNQQLRVNGLRWGLDNWIYCASGSHHGGYGDKTVIKSHTGKEFRLGSRDFKIHPETGDLIALSGPSQFGRARDDWGNWFGVQNSYPIWHYTIEDPYLQRNPDVTYPSPKKLLTERNPKVYPAKQPQKRFHSFTQSGRFTSACSVEIYRDDLLFRKKNTHVFTCEPFHNLVQHNVLAEDRYSFKLSRDPGEPELDFFTSTDRWCRPVQARTGPDGCLWVVDMYRYMIEHPQWLPPGGREELRPHYRAGEDRGRIWRIRPTQRKRRPVPNLAEADRDQLAGHLASPNGIVRDMTQRLMIERGGEYPELGRQILASRQNKNSALRLHATAVLDGLGQSSFHSAAGRLSDPDPKIRRFALQLLEKFEYQPRDLRAGLKHLASRMPGTHAAILRQMQSEKYPHVRLQIALTLGQLKHADFGNLLANMANGDLSDPHMRSAILSSIPTHFDTVVKRAVAHQGISHPLFPDLLSMGLKHPTGLALGLTELLKPVGESYSDQQFLTLAAWLQSLARKSTSLTKLANSDTNLAVLMIKFEAMLDGARHLAANGKSTAAFALLGKQAERRDTDLDLLTGILTPQNPPALQRAAAVALVRGWRAAAAPRLTARWTTLSPTVRSAAIDELLTRSDLIPVLLTKIGDGQIAASDLTVSQRQKLTKHRSSAIRRQAAGVLKNSGNPDRQAVIAKYQSSLRLAPDAPAGKAVFDQLCLICHRTDQPNPVGPDLRSITDKSKAGLLAAILDPNQSVDPRYTTYTIDLKDDSTLSGRILSESGNSLTLLTAEAKSHSVVRSQIAHFQGSRLSLMPEGLEAGMTAQQLADVIEYVRLGLK
jgi:putative membrane-bound dehydrogenase-like protein